MKNGENGMAEVTTDKQYDGILQMIGMILDGCKDLNEAKKKIEELREGKKKKINKKERNLLPLFCYKYFLKKF